MSHIRMECPHTLELEDARNRIAEVEGKLKQKYGLQMDWRGDTANVKGKGVSGTVELKEESVKFDLKLGLFLRPLAGKIQSSIEEQIKKAMV